MEPSVDQVPPDGTASIRLDVALDLPRTLGPLRLGRRDPAMQFLPDGRIVRVNRTPDGPVTLELTPAPGRVVARAWGPGADFALDRVPGLLGLDDPTEAFQPEHPKLLDVVRRRPGLRLARTWDIAGLLWPIVLQQLVTGPEAKRTYLNLVAEYGTDAPGPYGRLGLRLLPEPRILARLPWHEFVAAGAIRKQGQTISRICMVPGRMEEAATMDTDAASARLQAIEGVGPWTAHGAMVRGMGFADAVPTGDFHLPNTVAWFFEREARADDARMLELLEPFGDDRGRVVRLIEASGESAPKRGPRHRIRPRW